MCRASSRDLQVAQRMLDNSRLVNILPLWNSGHRERISKADLLLLRDMAAQNHRDALLLEVEKELAQR